MNNPFEIIEIRLSKIENLLSDLKIKSESSSVTNNHDELLTVQDAAKFLSLSVPTIYGLISKNEIPVMKRSKRCYFSKQELVEYLKQGRKRTNTETVLQAQSFISSKKG